MTVEQACQSIMGRKLADAITADQGLHWTVVAAMAQATTDDDPTAIETLRTHTKEQRAALT